MQSISKGILVDVKLTIRDALLAINSDPGIRTALVIESGGNLKGVITDGDVRRALLSNYTLDHPLLDIMNSSPISASPETSKKALKRIMNEKGIGAIPIISEGVLIGVETLHDLGTLNTYDNPVFIMAGGFGTRLRPLTDNCPKPLLEVGGRPLLETLLLNFKNAGFNNFYISTHYLPEMIHDHFGDGSKYDVKITYVHEEQPLGTGGALGLLPSSINDLPILMINGDVLTAVDFQKLLEFHNQHKAIATMCVKEYEYQVPYGVIKGDGTKVVSMEEKPLNSVFVNAGIYVVDSKILSSITKNKPIDMPTLLEQHIFNDEDVLMFPIHEYWLDIGRMEDFNKAQKDFSSLGFCQL